ncbi:hypothetical protein BKA59DRAFT_497663 [Fusarium tricinctum]|uniref:Uncharacterized protein n=1 Tax=Fusarium tricinctum TaxID=61284 RepID=A0A8K0RJ59_9HYPO|nr:hypothetical protein BKA59DRAFT_497663 [Fusarium tricinctum]
MWPLEFREHQYDDHTVEQNETTPWLQHTGWPRLFHSRPLGIIAATAKKPKPAWNEDYLLGQWHNTRETTNYDWNLDKGYKGDKGESSKCDNKDNNDNEDDRENDEKHINEYDQVKTEVHSNGNDAHYDMNDEPTGDISTSTIIHYTAVLGIQGPSLTFHPAHSSSPKLSALMWIGRLLFLEYAVPISGYNTLHLAWPCRTAYPSQPDRISSIRCKYLLRGCYTPFGELIELKAFAKSIVKREGIPGNLTWAPDGRSFTIGDNKKVLLSEFCEIYHRTVTTVQEQVDEMLLGWQPDIDVFAIRDDLTCRKAGWSFIDKIENNLKSSFRGTPFTTSGYWNAETFHKYLSAGVELNKSAFTAIHFRAGLPGRGTEVTSIRYLNSKLSKRNVFFYDGQMIIVISYNKARASNNYAFYIIRYVPADLSLSLLKYLAIVRPVWEFLAREMQTLRHDSKEFFFLDPIGKRKHLSSEQASSILRSRTQDLNTPWTLSLYRQAALAIAKRYLAKLVDKANFYYPSSAGDPIRMFAAGAGHHPRMLLTTYAINRALPERLQPELLEMYRRLSNIWQEWSRSYHEECCLQLQEGSTEPNTTVADELCLKRPAEPNCKDRVLKKLKTDSNTSCYNNNETNYSNGFLYNPEYQILVCITCESMVQPGQSAFYRHLNNTHRIKGLACKALIKRFNAYELCPFKKLVIPREKISPVPGLAVHTAFKCNVCVKVFGTPHFTSSLNKIRDHLIIHKLGISPMTAEELGMFQSCRVQTFSSARDKIRYFEVE